MNSFRNLKSVRQEKRYSWALTDSKSHCPGPAKVALLAAAAVLPALTMIGCRHTPEYSGPPNDVVHILMKKWAIIPNRIEVPQGSHVELVVTTADVEHGIGVSGLEINEPVQPGRTTVVRFLAQTPGTYPMRCSVLCGRGHSQMTGVIVIVPPPRSISDSGAVHK